MEYTIRWCDRKWGRAERKKRLEDAIRRIRDPELVRTVQTVLRVRSRVPGAEEEMRRKLLRMLCVGDRRFRRRIERIIEILMRD